MRTIITLTAIPFLALLTACSTNPQESLVFGESVKQVTEMQIMNPDAREQYGTEVYGQMDGQMGENAMDVYRSDIDKPQEVKNEIQVNIGS